SGLVGVDLAIAGDKAWIIEINPRYSSSAEVVERMTGINVVDAHVKACRGEEFELPASFRSTRTTAKPDDAQSAIYGKLILYAKRETFINEKFHAWAMNQSSLDPQACRLADIPAVGETIANGHPILTALDRKSVV